MLAPALFVLSLAQGEQPFVKPLSVVDLNRLALSPKLDGKIAEAEWEPLASEGPAKFFFQWEPGKLHFAGTMPKDQALLASVDLKADGWLVGKDNLEVRVSWKEGKALVSARVLDATNPAGPVWADAGGFMQTIDATGAEGDGGWSVEGTVGDPGLRLIPTDWNKGMNVRMDAVPEASGPSEPFLPRSMSALKLVMQSGYGVPGVMKWNPDFRGRTVVPGGSLFVRWTFNGSDDLGLNRINISTEGLSANDTKTLGMPFPGFDRKGRTFVDYDTPVGDSASDGFRILRAEVLGAKDTKMLLRASYKIAPLVNFDLVPPRRLQSKGQAQTVKFSVYIRSNTVRRVDGQFQVVAPSGWEVDSGNEKSFLIFNARGSVRKVFALTIPAGAKGSFPIKLMAVSADRTIKETIWINIP